MTLAKLSRLQVPFQNSRGSGLTARAWHASRTYSWAVPSYDLVWGKGHRYAGATLTVPRAHENAALEAFLLAFRGHLESPSCSDCVAVLHRVGPGLRRAANASLSTSSFHPGLATAALWLEMDCGLFRDGNPFRHLFTALSPSSSGKQSWMQTRWQTCSDFVDSAQLALDGANDNHNDNDSESSFHYPNVPNLQAGQGVSGKGWEQSYYGSHYPRLQRIKMELDPSNLFRHHQSIRPLRRDETSNRGDISSLPPPNSSCRVSFALAAYCDVLPLLALAATVGIGPIIRIWVQKLLLLFLKQK